MTQSHSPPEIQLQRLILRDSSSETDASARLSSQLPITKKLEYADIVIDNSGTREQLDNQAAALVEKTNKSAGGVRWLLNWLVPPAGVVSALWTLMSRNWFFRL